MHYDHLSIVWMTLMCWRRLENDQLNDVRTQYSNL